MAEIVSSFWELWHWFLAALGMDLKSFWLFFFKKEAKTGMTGYETTRLLEKEQDPYEEAKQEKSRLAAAKVYEEEQAKYVKYQQTRQTIEEQTRKEQEEYAKLSEEEQKEVMEQQTDIERQREANKQYRPVQREPYRRETEISTSPTPTPPPEGEITESYTNYEARRTSTTRTYRPPEPAPVKALPPPVERKAPTPTAQDTYATRKASERVMR